MDKTGTKKRRGAAKQPFGLAPLPPGPLSTAPATGGLANPASSTNSCASRPGRARSCPARTPDRREGARKAARRALVLGVGNILMGDEGLGVRVIELFERRYSLPEGVACVDGGVAGAALLSCIKDHTHIIVIDAVSSGASPATIHRFTDTAIKNAPSPATTTHQIGIKELIAIARFEGASPDMVFIGIVPGDISPRIGLSPSVEAALPRAAEMIKEELSALGFEVGRKDA